MTSFLADICQSNKILKKASLSIQRGRINSCKKVAKQTDELDFSEYTFYPGLINAHDHLLGTYLPKVGNGPYLNWKPWDEDLKQSSLYKERGKLSVEDIYELACYRQILSGVTTVSDHIPRELNRKFIAKAPIRIIKDYALSHEASSYDLNWGKGLEKEIGLAKKKDIPFITHLEEGWDEESMEGVNSLEEVGGLFQNTVLIHCIACNKADIKKIAQAKSSIVWCPSSNMFMFNETCDVDRFLKEKVNVSLGTDSPMSGGVNLLEEMRFSLKIFKKIYKKPITEKTIFKMVTENPAKAYKLTEIGKLESGFKADILALKTKGKDPYKQLTQTKPQNIEFLMVGGKVVFCKEDLAEKLKIDVENFQKIQLSKNTSHYLIGKPLELKKRMDRKLGFKKYLEFFPINI